jgi:hypothetical protein
VVRSVVKTRRTVDLDRSAGSTLPEDTTVVRVLEESVTVLTEGRAAILSQQPFNYPNYFVSYCGPGEESRKKRNLHSNSSSKSGGSESNGSNSDSRELHFEVDCWLVKECWLVAGMRDCEAVG